MYSETLDGDIEPHTPSTHSAEENAVFMQFVEKFWACRSFTALNVHIMYIFSMYLKLW